MSGSDRHVSRLLRTGLAGQRAVASGQPKRETGRQPKRLKFAPKPQRDAPADGAVAKRVDATERAQIVMSSQAAAQALGGERVKRAEFLRAKGWTVSGIAGQIKADTATVAALFGVGVGA